MRAYTLEQREANFAQNLTDSYGKKWAATPGEFPNVLRLTTTASKDFYYPEVVQKLKVWCHSTAGLGPSSDIGELTKPGNHVSVAFVIARSGQIYQLFPSDCWSYHLGPSSSAPNTYWSSHSVGIELCNIGPLQEDANDSNILNDMYGQPYCSKSDNKYYLANEYRGYKYFATYTDEQYRSLDSLILNICRKHGIQFSKIPQAQAYDWFAKIPDVGIVSHVNCRKDKLDLPPIFDWSRITGE